MSRAESTNTYNTASDQNTQNNTNSQNSYTQAQQDANDYQTSLSNYAAANPYVQGGQDQTVTNQQLSNTSDAAAQAAGQAMQSQAVRTGTNAAGSIAGTEASEQANERTLGGDEASATQQRIGSSAGYDQSVLGATATGEQQEAGLTGTEGQLAEGDLNAENTASANNKSFMDTLGSSFASGLGNVLSGNASAGKGCWIAAELYGGWTEPRTVLVRGWLNGQFSERPIGAAVMALYLKYGQRVAAAIRRWPVLRRVFQPLFDRALKQAQKGQVR